VAQILDMPQLSDTMKIGVLQKWRKNEGDKVSPGEVMAEIETDKAVMDFEAFDEGVLLKRLIVDGTSVPVGTPIAIIGKPGDDIAKLVEEAKARASGGGRPASGASARSEGGREWTGGGDEGRSRARADAEARSRAGAGRTRGPHGDQGAGVTAGTPDGDRSRHRPAQRPGHRPGWPHRRARREGRC
jgi:pyruvate dehydrogenase E2 component (dihydrolipoamide acetyltransferase)